MKKTILTGAFISAAVIAFAQQPVITPQQKSDAIDSAVKRLNTNYIFPEVAKKVERYLRAKQAKNAYANIIDGNAFAQALTNDMQAAGNDKHLWAAYSSEELPVEKPRPLMSIPDDERADYGLMLQRTNYGINKVDVLKGNIGYVDFNMLVSPEFAGDAYAAIMNYVEHTEALIIDLRNCGGAVSPDAVPFLCSYFFQSPVHLKDTYFKAGELNQSWTYAYVPGKKYLNKPVYVLISGATFSGAEEMAYDLKSLKRATIIGQPSGGGANPGGVMRLTNHFQMFVPVGRVVNPITGSNWEHLGVQPDTLINIKLALFKAQELAMRSSIKATNDDRWKNALTEWIAELKASEPKLKPITFELKGFDKARDVYVAGSFNGWSAQANKLQRKGDKWIVTADSEPGRITYKFIVDGQWMTDPANTLTQVNGQNTDSVKILE